MPNNDYDSEKTGLGALREYMSKGENGRKCTLDELKEFKAECTVEEQQELYKLSETAIQEDWD